MSAINVLVGMRIADGPDTVGSIGTCFHCLEAVGLSEDSRMAWRDDPGSHRLICVTCFLSHPEEYQNGFGYAPAHNTCREFIKYRTAAMKQPDLYIKKPTMTIWRQLRCWLGNHTWTCAAQEGIPATAEQLTDPFWGFWDYAKMYCRHCGTEAQISRESRAQHQRMRR